MKKVQDMYKDSETGVRCAVVGVTDGLKVGWDYIRDQL